ncbi:MAG: LytR C-terminal domain-containing protein [Actinomycetota bacterium]|nr:LytR C-terminal domain-containing protein [Actinomycetota bacterium]MDQ2958427.1 LytR C-terminal domain-containing protein [Actinomycetota bacterium]
MSAMTSRRPLPALVFLLVLTVLTAIVWWRVLHRPDGTTTADGPVTVQPIKCTPGGKKVTLPTPASVKVDVLNGAGREQLATQVSTLLKSRGFAVGTPGNAGALTGTGEIQFGSAGASGATLLSYYLPGAKMVAQKRSDNLINLVLGSGYQTLASPAAVTKAVTEAKKPC